MSFTELVSMYSWFEDERLSMAWPHSPSYNIKLDEQDCKVKVCNCISTARLWTVSKARWDRARVCCPSAAKVVNRSVEPGSIHPALPSTPRTHPAARHLPRKPLVAIRIKFIISYRSSLSINISHRSLLDWYFKLSVIFTLGLMFDT